MVGLRLSSQKSESSNFGKFFYRKNMFESVNTDPKNEILNFLPSQCPKIALAISFKRNSKFKGGMSACKISQNSYFSDFLGIESEINHNMKF